MLEMVDSCHAALAELPSYAEVSRSAGAAAARIVDFQSLNLGERQGGHEGLERWACEQTPRTSGLRWWETAAAGGSSLGVHALIGLAAHPRLEHAEVAAIDDAYFPWIGALHSLLDSVVDVAEDRRTGQRNLLGYYESPQDAATGLSELAARARLRARKLAGGHRHEVVLAAMTGYYLSAARAEVCETDALARAVARAAGPLTVRALPLFAAARRASALVRPAR